MVRLKWQHTDACARGTAGRGGGGGWLASPSTQNYISEMATFSCINSQFMDDAWSLKSLRPGLQTVVARACGCSSVRLSACAEHAVGVVNTFSIAGAPN